jgi:phage transcriptional activator, RinA family
MDRAVFRFVEHLIREYPDIKKILEGNELDFEVIYRNHDDRGCGVKNPTEAKALSLLSNKAKAELIKTKKAIYIVTSELPEDKYRMVELCYWKRPRLLSNEGIARELNISLPTFYEWKRGFVRSVGAELGLCNP